MTITTNAMFLLAAVGLGIWMKRDNSFRGREFLAVSLFWILLVATPWGAQAVNSVQEAFGSATQTASDTVNSVSGG
ncbi:hypothetical protein [Streptomyces xiamenensis]|uniref:hypothetical protein n=1 Tax=Streptomyces xiamenensis TaxID=408015 RepID=UPI0035DD5303